MSYDAKQFRTAQVIIFRLVRCALQLNGKFATSREFIRVVEWLGNSGFYNRPHGGHGVPPETIGIIEEVEQTLREDGVTSAPSRASILINEAVEKLARACQLMMEEKK